MITETERLTSVYRGYQESAAARARWDQRNRGNQAIERERYIVIGALLNHMRMPICQQSVLEIGCGSGRMLAGLLNLGVRAGALWGLDLLPDRVADAAHCYPQLRLMAADGAALPFPDEQFDVVLFSTVFSSILDWQMASSVAAETRRVLRQNGAVLWYDFRYDNPRNPHVRGITKADIKRLFPDFELRLRTITLVPPLARRLGLATRPLYPLLERIPLLRTHYLGLLVKR